MNDSTPILTRAQVRLVDELAIRDLGIPSIVLMENAGRNAAEVIAGRYPGTLGTCAIFCGAGNNGGDGFVVARHLHNAGHHVQTFLIGDVARLTADAATNHGIAAAMGIPINRTTDADAIIAAVAALSEGDVIVDALLGTGFAGAVRSPVKDTIEAFADSPVRRVVAIDVPSGLDCDTGEVGNVATRAALTVTFVAAKTGFSAPGAEQYVGEVVVVGIGAPPELIARAAEAGNAGSG